LPLYGAIVKDWSVVKDSQSYLIMATVITLVGSLLWLTIDPTSGDHKRLDKLETEAIPTRSSSPKSTNTISIDPMILDQKPIFVMTTGANSYQEKKIEVLGISITPSRRAALVLIEGGSPFWMPIGDVSSDIRLIEVGMQGARFDTPVGSRLINLRNSAEVSKDEITAEKEP
jgi:hypothetical protein